MRLLVIGVVALAASPASAVASGSDWPISGYSPEQTYYNPNEATLSAANIGQLVAGWSIGFQYNSPQDEPVVAGGIAYFGLSYGGLYAVSVDTGSVLWTYLPPDGGTVTQSPAVANGIVCFGSTKGHIYAINTASGTLVWTAPGSIAGDVLVADGRVFVPSSGATSGTKDIVAYDASTGATDWTSASGPGYLTDAAYADGVVYVTQDAIMTAMSASTGLTLWSQVFLTGQWDAYSASQPLVENGVVYGWSMLGTSAGTLEAFDTLTGGVLWDYQANWFGNNIAFANGLLYVSYNGTLSAIDVGEIVPPMTLPPTLLSLPIAWTIPSGWLTSVAVANGVIYYNQGSGMQAAVAATGASITPGPNWPKNFSGNFTVGDGNLLLSTASGCGPAICDYRLPGSTHIAIASQVAPTPIELGATFNDTATVGPPPAGAATPTGTVTFNAYPPGDPTCSGAPVFSSTNALNAAGTTATSDNFTPTTTGTYRVIATYNGDTTYSRSASSCAEPTEAVLVTDEKPTAAYTASTYTPAQGQTVSFSGSASSDPDGTIASYDWKWGDGTPDGSGATPTHVFTSQGRVVVSLYVTDSDGQTAVVGHGLTVGPPADEKPTAAYTASTYTPAQGQTVSFNGSASSDPDGTIASYDWKWGDGTPDGSGATPTHVFTSQGRVVVSLYVTDSDGQTAVVGHGLTVGPPAPTPSVYWANYGVDGSGRTIGRATGVAPR